MEPKGFMGLLTSTSFFSKKISNHFIGRVPVCVQQFFSLQCVESGIKRAFLEIPLL